MGSKKLQKGEISLPMSHRSNVYGKSSHRPSQMSASPLDQSPLREISQSDKGPDSSSDSSPSERPNLGKIARRVKQTAKEHINIVENSSHTADKSIPASKINHYSSAKHEGINPFDKSN